MHVAELIGVRWPENTALWEVFQENPIERDVNDASICVRRRVKRCIFRPYLIAVNLSNSIIGWIGLISQTLGPTLGERPQLAIKLKPISTQ